MRTICTLLLALVGWFAITSDGFTAASDPVIITVVFSNDVHGGIDRTKARFMNDEFPPPLGGGASAATIIQALRKQAKSQGHGFLLLDAGDFFSGSLIGSETSGRAVIDYMNAVKYDALAIGNHEFDQGWENLRSLVARANFPALSANIVDDSTGELLDFLKPFIIKEINGIRIAIFGLTTHSTPRASFPDNISGIRFIDEIKAGQKAIAAAKAQGAEFIIGISHNGLPYSWEEGYKRLLEREAAGFPGEGVVNDMETARQLPELDVLFSGHIHVGYREPWVDPVTHVPCFQNYGRGTGVGAVNLKIDRQTKKLIGWDTFADDGALITLFEDEFPPDEEVDKMIKKESEVLEAVYQQTIGYTPITISRAGDGESPLGNLITDSWREQFGADLAITNTGGIRDEMPPGNIILQHIFNVLPFGNSLVVMVVSGAFIKDLLENKIRSGRVGFAISGVNMVIDMNRPEGDRITEIAIGAQSLEMAKSYQLVTTSYLREGNSSFDALAEVGDDYVSYSGVLERDALAQYIKRKGEVNPTMEGRIRVITPTQ
ncbi:MAG: bifunctional UDP-sugar hydrolase/5'-nucleotidase [bacterium]